MILEEFYKATEGMPKDAKVYIDIGDEYRVELAAPEIEYNKDLNTILIFLKKRFLKRI